MAAIFMALREYTVTVAIADDDEGQSSDTLTVKAVCEVYLPMVLRSSTELPTGSGDRAVWFAVAAMVQGGVAAGASWDDGEYPDPSG